MIQFNHRGADVFSGAGHHAEGRHDQDGVDARHVFQRFAEFVQDLIRAFDGCPARQFHIAEERAFVLFRQEGTLRIREKPIDPEQGTCEQD